MGRACLVACQIQLPHGQERILGSRQKGSPDILTEDAAILVLLQKVLLQPRGQLIVPRVGADPDNPVAAVRPLSLFE
jgi:hypothetical protein